MKNRISARTLIAAVAFCLCPFATIAKPDQGVTDDSIHVGLIADLSGPLAYYGNEILNGMQVYFKKVNDNGGVHGRKLILHCEDDGYQPPRTIAAFRKLIDRDRVFCFAGNLGSATTVATFPFIEREKVPVVHPVNFNSLMHTPFKRYVFSSGPSYDLQSWIIVNHIVDTIGKETPRIAVIYQDDDYGRDGLNGLRDAAESHGIEIVSEESYKRGTVDLSSQTLNVKSFQPTHVILWTTVREAAAILKKANQIGLDVPFIGGGPVGDPKLLELAGANAENFHFVSTVDLWNSDKPQIIEYRETKGTYEPERDINNMHLYGYITAQILTEGLQRAGRELDRERLIEALETINNWQGTAGSIINYSSTSHGALIDRAFIMKADAPNNQFVAITPWISANPDGNMASSE